MPNPDLPYIVAFSHCYGFGPVRFQKLLTLFDSMETAFHASRDKLEQYLGASLARTFVDYRQTINPTKLYSEIIAQGIDCIGFGCDDYPLSLSSIKDPPICLYAKGKKDLLNREASIAIVGTRNPTLYGKKVTYEMAQILAQSGLIIISGLALGIDATAHQAALDCGGATIAVLGCGVNIIYPPAHKDLYERILKEKGCIVSEFPPNMYVQKGLFVARNRIISALSQGVLVVEGSATSGTLITARYAADQGKDVFAIPSPITSDQSKAPNILLKEGAIVVTEAQDILDTLRQPMVARPTQEVAPYDDAVYNMVLHALSTCACTPDGLARELDMSIDALLTVISDLELDGYIVKDSEGRYFISTHIS